MTNNRTDDSTINTTKYRLPGVPETYYRTGYYTVDHSTFSGELSLFDFEGHHTLVTMAQKIATCERFDKQCKTITLRRLSLKKKVEEKNND